ncbi:hypothetical protein FACS1894172_03620 [Spirochaetia bacterium]|nr:hypothetical protein FACS1894172_03620 [Spirochaetia bacterium]
MIPARAAAGKNTNTVAAGNYISLIVKGMINKNMKDLNTCNEYELFFDLASQIMSGEITTFAELKSYVEPVLKNIKMHPIIMQAFALMQRLNWGFFSTISRSKDPRLWRELVVPDPVFTNAGELKKTLSISNLYVSMLDIHGYTKFCNESRNNLAKLHALDRVINKDVQNIVSQCYSLSRRERGDEILILSAHAVDAITASLSIIEYFANTKIVRDPSIKIIRSGDVVNLPAFKVSGGIAGGQTPLIITESGDLSGSLINTAARLQARANELSPKESKIMITRQVYLNMLTESKNNQRPMFKDNVIHVFDTGLIEFKGTLVPTCEILFKTEDRYKEKYEEEFTRLYNSVRISNWEQKIFVHLMELLCKVLIVMPGFSIPLEPPIAGLTVVTNTSFRKLCEQANYQYQYKEDYIQAIELLKNFVVLIKNIPVFDRLVFDYAKGIANRYSTILDRYYDVLNKQIDANLSNVFDQQQLKTYEAVKKANLIYQELRSTALSSAVLGSRKSFWYNLIDQNRENLSLTIYSGKK